ncbi:MAG: hypothetical protein HY509_02635 [Acidobacteria bacterium]|nr:hypothetical protein [Acidobacteriota bacterium]
MCRGWELAADRKALTLHLREGVVWSDGTPTTAHDGYGMTGPRSLRV